MRNLMKLVALATLIVTFLGLSQTPVVAAQRTCQHQVPVVAAQHSCPPRVMVPAAVDVPSLGITIRYERRVGARVISLRHPKMGRVGTDNLEVYDVILSIGGVAVTPGANLDTLMARAKVNGLRYMSVLDRNTNTVLVLTWCR